MLTPPMRTLVSAALLGIASLASAQTSSHGGTMQHSQQMQHGRTMGNVPASPGSRELHQSMMAGMQDMQRRPLSGDVDKDFIRLMRQHHLQGIEMARIELEKGDDGQAREMAQKILRSQQEDVQKFDRWLERHEQ